MEFLSALEKALISLVPDLDPKISESKVQDMLYMRLKKLGLNPERRVKLTSESWPEVEVDILCGGWAVEVKLFPRFYDGIGQVISYGELFGLNGVLVQIWRSINEKAARGLEKISRNHGFKAFLVDMRGRMMKVG